MNFKLKAALGAAAVVLASQAMAQITLYEHDGYRGRAFTTDRDVRDLQRQGFNDIASSVVIDRGRWEVCENARFEGRCVVLRRGSYDSLRSMGMNDRISSLRRVDDNRAYRNEAPPPVSVQPAYEWRQRPNERLFDAPVTSVRAVVAAQQGQRCWVERQQVSPGGQPNVGGAIVGGLLGGVIGHQIGGGSGRDVATGVGVVTGAAIGANSGGGSTGAAGYQDVQRCQTVNTNVTPQYYDVSYVFRGVEHHVQMTAPPAGSTIAVNDRGEPRM